MKTLILLFSSFLMAAVASARTSSSGEEFQRLVVSAQSLCPVVACSSTSIRMKTLTAAEASELPQETRNRLDVAANELSQIWGDTILEGDYYSDEEARVDKIQLLYQDQAFVGYRITYSAKAWDTATCEFRGDKPSLVKCQVGKIIESGFVSADFSTSFEDAHAPAIFAD